MYPSPRNLMEEFLDPEYRQAYADDYLNTYVATQIRVLREQRGLSQEALANLIGTKQSGISRLENVNYSSWKTDTLRRIAHALDVRLKISFETYGDLLFESDVFGKRFLQRPGFAKDPAFSPAMANQVIVGTYWHGGAGYCIVGNASEAVTSRSVKMEIGRLEVRHAAAVSLAVAA